MMKENNIDKLFKRLEHDFNVEAPNANHQKQFLEKLNNQQRIASIAPKRNLWKPFIGIAASLALLISVFVGSQYEENVTDLASISPEMAETQNFFTSTIATELSKFENESNPEAKLLIKDALIQMQRLEKEYNSLKDDLLQSGEDKRVIYAMITNFQNRIDILQNTLKQIETVKQLKNIPHEKSTII